LPTPFEPLDRFGAALGVPLWIKRDDLTGLGLGGNKVRKLEFLIGDAIAHGCDTVVTFGALQSNHARQTAAACAKSGLRCVLILTTAVARTSPSYTSGGNVLLDQLFGAEMLVVDNTPEAIDVAINDVRSRLRADGAQAKWFPAGGSNAIGAAGYVMAGLELAQDAQQAGIDLTDVILATSTGGTQAGLLLGLRAADSNARVHGIAVFHDAASTSAAVTELADDTARLLGLPAVPTSEIIINDHYLGPSYGVPTDGMITALRQMSSTEGVLMDPVYSGKATHGLMEMAGAGAFSASGAVALMHTGGSPSVFAYGEELGAPAPE